MHWPKATWALVVFNVLMLIWVIAGIASTSGNATDCGSLSQDTCNAARSVGTGIGVSILLVLWFIGFVILSLIWLMSRPRRRQCPACGNDARRGQTSCATCGHSFLHTPATTTVVLPSPEAWTSPDGTQRWTGREWVRIDAAVAGPPPAPTQGQPS